MAAVDTVFEQLGSMTVLELVELKKKIEDEWGITAAAPVAGDRRQRPTAVWSWRAEDLPRRLLEQFDPPASPPPCGLVS